MDNLIIKTSSGLIEGILSSDNKTRIFKGVPYADPPVGNLRFKRPRKKASWQAIRPTKSFSPKAYQADQTKGRLYPKEFYSGDLPPMSEDCLYLNIWTPEKIDKPLPVFMWIHGGAYMHGYASEIAVDGEEFARNGVIFVSINYRTGALAFFTSDELDKEFEDNNSGNLAIHDQIFALDWIIDNIAEFGGDPSNITVGGQSAGCMASQMLITSDLTRGKIKRAILQSAAGFPAFGKIHTKDVLKSYSKELMDILNVSSLEQLRECSPESICNAGYQIIKNPQGLTWGPYLGNDIIKKDPTELIQEKKYHDIEYIIGSTGDELGFGTGELLAKSAINFASLNDNNMYVYCFKHKLPSSDDGAFHSCELWYEFNTLDRCWRDMQEEDYQIAKEMSKEFANFIKGEKPSPDWNKYQKDKPCVRIY